MKKFYFKCKLIPSGEKKEVIITAEDYQEAEQKLVEQKKYIPIEYVGWEDITC